MLQSLQSRNLPPRNKALASLRRRSITVNDQHKAVAAWHYARRGSWIESLGAIALIIVFLLPLAASVSPGGGLAAQVGREAVYWALALIIVGYVVIIEHRPLSSLGLRRPGWKSAVFGVAAAAVMVAGSAGIYLGLFPALGLSPNDSAMSTLQATPLWFRTVLILRAAVFEELYFRGFMIERLASITGVRWLAALISLLAFTFAHLRFWGWPHLLIAGFAGGILTGLYLWRRDLTCNMIAHLLTDAVGFLAG
jgi:membrane protease YdiL (CAAX protease family)